MFKLAPNPTHKLHNAATATPVSLNNTKLSEVMLKEQVMTPVCFCLRVHDDAYLLQQY